ncbi:hypothetical protein M407DRAFT_231008 [Tulasnella calospora MUT 4182]|uniref:WW domain-containing protein n=1 Tax=Tulasnella calospora MUT 4182 TaxID=1051891 RepID=A0A0C3QC63_9AGAM|nr:hypothetical protein M407DRAFT_231008 [Tulasnella calospora MUT 4182]
MAHDDGERDWGEDDGWASEQVVATMDVDRSDLIHAGGDGGASQQTLDDDDSPHVPEKVGVSQEPKADVSPTHPATRNGGFERKDSRRTPSRSSSDFGKALPSSLPQRPTTIAPHVEESDPLAASAMARSPSKSTNGLPPDWEERKSRRNGKTYFFNLKTEETTWTKPTVPTAVSSTRTWAHSTRQPLHLTTGERKKGTNVSKRAVHSSASSIFLTGASANIQFFSTKTGQVCFTAPASEIKRVPKRTREGFTWGPRRLVTAARLEQVACIMKEIGLHHPLLVASVLRLLHLATMIAAQGAPKTDTLSTLFG